MFGLFDTCVKASMRETYFEGYSVSHEFYSPDYSTMPLPSTPDYRRTLYWNPNVQTDERGRANVLILSSTIMHTPPTCIYRPKASHRTAILWCMTAKKKKRNKKLLCSFDALIQRGHTIVIIEHNMEVIKCADHIIDIGPEGGDRGGQLVVYGTPEEVVSCEASYTARFLREKLT